MIIQKLRESLRSNADHNAFCFSGRYFTYKELELKSLSVAGQIMREIKKTNPRIAVITNNDLETYASVFAIWLCGGVFIPVNPAFPFERNKKILSLSKAEIILNSRPENIFSNEICTSENYRILKDFPDNTTNAKDLMYILFTSGSTGDPKGVPITYGNVTAFVSSFMSNGYFFSTGDRFLQPFELTFDASLDCYLIPVLYGACVYPVPSEGMRYLQAAKTMQENKVTVAKLTPSMTGLLKPYFSKLKLPSLRYCLFGGEGLPVQLVNDWQKCIPNAQIHNLYGPTEATVECFFYNATPSPEIRSHKGFMSIGKPTGDTIAIIADDNGNFLPADQDGELCLAGSQVTAGYLDKSINKKKFFDKISGKKKYVFYRTGDIALYDKDGYFFCVGRNDRQVKVQGYRVELDEIEIQASSFYTGYRFASILTDEKILLFTDMADNTELLSMLSQKLPLWMIPSEIISIPEIPVNINGKTDYQLLKEYGK